MDPQLSMEGFTLMATGIAPSIELRSEWTDDERRRFSELRARAYGQPRTLSGDYLFSSLMADADAIENAVRARVAKKGERA